jgi:hypothetical protein
MIGDCKNIPCGTSINFEGVLMSLFATNKEGCVGIKVFTTDCVCGEGRPGVLCEDALMCTTNLSLEQLVLKSIVDDGCGGRALKIANLRQMPDCPELCGMQLDFETLLKRLFVKVDDCFAVRITPAPLTCTNGKPFAVCGTRITAEQAVRGSIFKDECSGYTLPIIMLTEDCTNKLPCDLSLTIDQIIAGLFVKLKDFCGGALLVNYSSEDCEDLSALKDCGTFYTFEQMLRRSLIKVDCGYALNIFIINNLAE